MRMQDIPDPDLPDEVKQAFDIAYNNIRAFHEAQKTARIEVETMPGVRCSREARAIGESRSTLPMCQPLASFLTGHSLKGCLLRGKLLSQCYRGRKARTSQDFF